MSCKHDEYQFHTRIIELEPGQVMAILQLRCGQCQHQLHWRGVEIGSANYELPTTSADGYELRAPVAIGLGGTVGFLQQVGLVDRLRDPDAAQ